MNKEKKEFPLVESLGDYFAFAIESWFICLALGLGIAAGFFALMHQPDQTNAIFVSSLYGFWLSILVGLAVEMIFKNGWLALLSIAIVYGLILADHSTLAVSTFFGFWLALFVGLILSLVVKRNWVATTGFVATIILIIIC